MESTREFGVVRKIETLCTNHPLIIECTLCKTRIHEYNDRI